METILESKAKTVVIGPDRPLVIIGERINPTGRKQLAAEMAAGNYDRVRADAVAQVEAGAHMLDVNAGIPMADEPAILADAIRLVQSTVDVPICVDSSVVAALEALGYSSREGRDAARAAVASLGPDATLEDRVKEALQTLRQ